MDLRQIDEFKSLDSEVGHGYTSRFTNHLKAFMYSIYINSIKIYTKANSHNKFNQNQNNIANIRQIEDVSKLKISDI